jgi:tRNA splicing ligase
MIIKKFLMYAKSNDGSNPLRGFVESMYLNPLYPEITKKLISQPGFIKKINTLTETAEYSEFRNEIYFEDQETFDVYFSDNSIINLYEYIQVMANAEGIETKWETIT